MNINWSLEGFFTGNMPHWMCIGNGWNIAIQVLCAIAIAVGYFMFRNINSKISRTHQGSDYFITRKVWKGFGNVFLWCGIKSIFVAITMFVSAYWLQSIVMIVNAFWIWYTVRHFSIYLPLFQAKTIADADQDSSKRELMATISDLRAEILLLKNKAND